MAAGPSIVGIVETLLKRGSIIWKIDHVRGVVTELLSHEFWNHFKNIE